MVLLFLFIIIIAIAYFIFYFKLSKETYKFFKPIFLKKQMKKQKTISITSNATFDKKKEISWLPEYPVACRCKNRLDNREIAAFLNLSHIITTRSGTTIKWLDLCCGNGNILAQIDKTIREKVSKVEYYGFDIDKGNVDECKKIIFSKKLDQRLAKVKVDVVNLDSSPIPGDGDYDIITLLNVMHEINPFNIFPLLRKALDRCQKDGVVVIVDMIDLPHLEWGAVTWSTEHLKAVISYLTKDENITSLDEKISLLIFERKVDIYCLKLEKKHVNEDIFSIWNSEMEVKKRNNIINCFLEEKKKMLSDQLTKIYYEKENKDNSREDLESKVSKILWEYRAVCEYLSNFRKSNDEV